MTKFPPFNTKYLAPRPWTVDTKSIGARWTNSISIMDANGGHVAHLTRGYEGDANGEDCPSFANARMISAAPDLLAALKLYDETYCSTQSHPTPAQEAVCMNTARAAIAKAIG